MDGIYDTVIIAHRDLTRTFTWTDDVDDPIDLSDYNRLVYNLQTDDATPTEILTVDSDDNPTYLYIDSPASAGVIQMAIPGSELNWIASNSGRWAHELVLFDINGGQISLFQGNVLLKKPIYVPAGP